MAIKRIQIINLGAFGEGPKSIDFDDLPGVVLFQGGNGAGKTTMLDCLRYIAERGHDPDIIHGDAEIGEVIVTFDNGNMARARASRKSGETTRGWKPADGKRWIMDRSLIDEICKSIAYDPIKFLDKTPAEQAEQLLKISPITVSPEEIQEAAGEAAPEAGRAKIVPGMGALELLAAIDDTVRSQRRALNAEAESLGGHAKELEESLRAALPDDRDWASEAEGLQAGKDSAEASQRREVAALGTGLQAARDASKKQYDADVAAIDADITAKIAALERERVSRRESAAAKATDAVEEARTKANGEATDIKARYAPIIERAIAALATARAHEHTQNQIKGTQAAIETARSGAETKAARSKILTGALERLAELKLKLAGRLPIPGVMVEGGRIVREQEGGLVPLKRWNTADQMALCLKIGRMVGSKAGFMVLDHIEAFDAEHRQGLFAAAQNYAEQSGMQFIFAGVDAGPLRAEYPTQVEE